MLPCRPTPAMKATRLIFLLFLCSESTAKLNGQVPQLINFQGRVAVEGVNFKLDHYPTLSRGRTIKALRL